MTITLTWLFAYLLGSIPFGVLLARMRRVDLRQHGSGNIGATNVARTLGKTAGVLTLLGDCGKGYLAGWLAGMFIAVMTVTRYVSLSSVLASVSIPWFGLLFEAPAPYLYVGAIAGVISIARHWDNFQRLLQGTEDKFK